MRNNDYAAIQQYIRQAQIERSVYLAEVISQTLVNAWNSTRSLAASVVAALKAKRTPRNDFTFNAR